MDWTETSRTQLMTIEDAVALVKSGQTIVTGIPEPVYFLNALAQRNDLSDVTVTSALGGPGLQAISQNPSFNAITSFSNIYIRDDVLSGRIAFRPGGFFGAAKQMTSLKPDLVVLTVTTPEADGTVRPGCVMAFDDTLMRNAKQTGAAVLALVDENEPHAYGAAFHVSDFDGIIPQPAKEAAPRLLYEESPHAKAIAETLAEFVPDGATLQGGVGDVPDFALAKLTHLKDSGVHTEVLGAGLATLVDQGIATSIHKPRNTGKATYTMANGQAIDMVGDDERYRILGSSDCLDPRIIAENPRLRCVNAAVAVDLFGQGSAEMVNGKQFSGIGGQQDFLRACHLSEDALAIIVLESTARNDTISRICPVIPEGNVISATRYDIDVVITEYGAAVLQHATVKERAERLIAIAHPKFREELERSAHERGILTN